MVKLRLYHSNQVSRAWRIFRCGTQTQPSERTGACSDLEKQLRKGGCKCQNFQEKTEQSHTSAGVHKDGFVKNQGKASCEDVREGSDRCVGPAVGFGSPDCDSHHTTSNVTSCVGGKANRSVAPEDCCVAEADNNRDERGGNVEIGRIDAGPDDRTEKESLSRN